MDEENKLQKMPSPLSPFQPLSITYLTPTVPRTQAELAMEQACQENEDLPPLNRTEPLIMPFGAYYLCPFTLSPRWRCVQVEGKLMRDSLRSELMSPGSSSSLSPSVGKSGIWM